MDTTDLLSLFVAQFREWWPYVTDFFGYIYNFLGVNLDWIRLGFLAVSAVLLVFSIILGKKFRDDMESFRGLRLRDLFGFGTKRPIKYLKRWTKVEENLESGEKERIRMAVIEARHLFDDLFDESGYKGLDFRERFERFAEHHNFERRDDLLDGEEVARSLERNPEQKIDYEGASEIIKVYREGINEIYKVEE